MAGPHTHAMHWFPGQHPTAITSKLRLLYIAGHACKCSVQSKHIVGVQVLWAMKALVPDYWEGKFPNAIDSPPNVRNPALKMMGDAHGDVALDRAPMTS